MGSWPMVLPRSGRYRYTPSHTPRATDELMLVTFEISYVCLRRIPTYSRRIRRESDPHFKPPNRVVYVAGGVVYHAVNIRAYVHSIK